MLYTYVPEKLYLGYSHYEYVTVFFRRANTIILLYPTKVENVIKVIFIRLINKNSEKVTRFYKVTASPRLCVSLS